MLASGVDTCFTNPGTSEMHFVAALDRIPGMRCVLGLQENVVTGAADGYARMQDRPASTLLHCGPGLANGLANLHNARRARSPIVNLVGDQATYHRPLDAPLTADTEGWARPVSLWTRTARSAATVGADAAEAVQAAQDGIATLILPSDTCWDEGGVVAERAAGPRARRRCRRMRCRARRGRCARASRRCCWWRARRCGRRPLAVAAGIAAATGARMLAQTQNARIERGAGRVAIERVPYPDEPAVAALAGLRHLILVGAGAPVGFFAYPGKPSRMYPEDCEVHVLARPEQDWLTRWSGWRRSLGARAGAEAASRRRERAPARGAVDVGGVRAEPGGAAAGARDRGG